jgi:hypothetical protein
MCSTMPPAEALGGIRDAFHGYRSPTSPSLDSAGLRDLPLDASEHVFDTGCVDREPVEHAPDRWRGELEHSPAGGPAR